MAKYEVLDDDGAWVELTREEAWDRKIAECTALYGEEEGRRVAEADWRILNTPDKPWSELTEGERSLAKRMQAEEEVNIAARKAGYGSIFDLPDPYEDEYPDPLAPSDDDDEEVEIDLRGAREYDYEAASALAARKARERARGGKAGS